MIKKIFGLGLVFAFLVTPAFAEDPISQEILDQAKAQAGLFMDLKNALGLDWLDEYNAYLDDPTSSPEPSWAGSVAELVGKSYLSDAFPDDFSITSSGQEVTISRIITDQGIKNVLPIYLPSISISGDTVSLLVQRPAQWVAWEAGLNSKISRDGGDDVDVLPGASLEFGAGSEIDFINNDGKLVGIDSLTYKGEELEDRFVNAAGDNMTGPLTIEGNKVWHAGNDGSGSGLDADLLDGQHGSYYLAAGNLTGIVPVARLSGTYNIDISGRASVASEADNADKLDGKHAGDFALSGHTHGYVSKEGDTMTGALYFGDSNTSIYKGSNNSIRVKTDSGYVDIGPQNTGWAHFQTDRDKFYFNKPVNAVDELRIYNTSTYLAANEGRIDNNPIWHKGNDGSGSGLDADLLDGKHASSFVEQPTRIPAGQNLNNYTTPGLYYSPANVDVQQIANTPVNNAFSLLVERHAGVKQTFTEYVTNNPRTWVRNYYNGTWGPWVQVARLVEKTKTVNGYWYIGRSDRVEGGRRGGNLARGNHKQRFYYAPNYNASGAKQWYTFDELATWGSIKSATDSVGLANMVSIRVGIEAYGVWDSTASIRIQERNPSTGAVTTLVDKSVGKNVMATGYCTIRKGYQYNIRATLPGMCYESYDDGYGAHLWATNYTYKYTAAE